MKYTVIYQEIKEEAFPQGYYYAHVPALELTTHGEGIAGAREAAKDLIRLWLEEKKANNEPIPVEKDVLYSQIEIDDALLSA